MKKRVNCYSDYPFQVDMTTQDLGTGEHGPPAAGAITGVKLRLSETATGAAIHANVGNLAAQERAEVPGRFWVDVDAALLTTHVLPLGVGATFYAIWSISGDMDREAVPFLVADGTVN